MGADVKIDAWLGGSVRPEPISPTPFIRDKNLTAGASAASGILVLRSENGETEQIRLGLDANSIKDLADQTYARSVTINFGENGSLGSSTLEQLAEHPISPFAINPGATMRIPVAVTIPLSSGDAVAGQKIHVTIVPEQVR